MKPVAAPGMMRLAAAPLEEEELAEEEEEVPEALPLVLEPDLLAVLLLQVYLPLMALLLPERDLK